MLERMDTEDLREWRERLGLTGTAFGVFLAAQLGRDRPYTRQEISAWESGGREIPEAIERVYWQMDALNLNVKKRTKPHKMAAK